MGRRGVIAAFVALLAFAAPAAAAPDCVTPLPAPVTKVSGEGALESIVSDAQGRLFYTDTTSGDLKRWDPRLPGSAPQVALADTGTGGLVLLPDGDLLLGADGGFVNGAIGNVAPRSRILRIDLDPPSGTVLGSSVFADGLAMANGLARAADGKVYASDDVGLGVDRVSADGKTVDHFWAGEFSTNGLAIDSGQKWLYAARTFQPTGVTRFNLANPAEKQVFLGPIADWTGGPDGMTIDDHDRPVFTTNGGGEVWRMTPQGQFCVLARGLLLPSAVAYAPDGRLYVVTFSGVLAEVPAGRQAPAATRRRSARPRPRRTSTRTARARSRGVGRALAARAGRGS